MSRSNSPKRRVQTAVFREASAGQCPTTGKHRWLNRRAARHASRATIAGGTWGARAMQEYRCPDCDDWHIGHRPKGGWYDPARKEPDA